MRAEPLFLGFLAAAAIIAATAAGAAAETGGTKEVAEAFVTNQNDDTLTVVELATLKASDPIKIGGKPAGIAISGD